MALTDWRDDIYKCGCVKGIILLRSPHIVNQKKHASRRRETHNDFQQFRSTNIDRG